MPAASLHEDILDAVIAVIEDLDLDGMEDRVHKRLTLNQTFAQNLLLPCVIVSGAGMLSPMDEHSTNLRDGTGLPVTIRVLDRDPIDVAARESSLMEWHQTIRRALRTRRLTGLAEVWRLDLQAAPTLEELPEAYRLVSMPIVFQVAAIEPRT